MNFVYGLIVGTFAGGFLSYLYAAKVIADYKKAASTAGVLFTKLEGKVCAIRKAL